MMAAALKNERLMDYLPPVRGRLTENAALAPTTWFRTGGPAEVLFKPADAEDLAQFLAGKPHDIPVTVIGVGSNLLVRDGGVPGVVIKLGKGFSRIDVSGDKIICGAAALDGTVALTAQKAGIGGLEFLSGVPGTIGGALRMNAGAYGREMKDITLSAKAISPEGAPHELSPEDLGFSYRYCSVPDDWFFTNAVLQGSHEDPTLIAERMEDIKTSREESQPLRTRTGGSTFANPEGHKAWQLIDEAGCRGLKMGGAMVSEKHCNFLINTGDATAADIESLGEEVRRRVKEKSGIDLRWEIRRIGLPLEGGKS